MSAEENARLNVEIRQTSKGTGIVDTARDTTALTNAQKDAAKQAQGNAKAVNELGEASDKGAAAGRVLASALDGNVASLGQLGPLLKSTAALLKTNIVGALISVGAMAAAVVLPMIDGWMKTKDAAKEAEDQIKSVDRATADAKKSAEDLGKAQMDILMTNLDTIRRTADEADASFKSLLGRAQQLDDAKRALDLAKVEADPNLSEEDKVRKRAAINSDADARRAGRATSEVEGRVEAGRYVAEGAADQAKQANDQVGTAQSRVDELAGQRSSAERERDEIMSAYRKRQEEILKSTPDGYERQYKLRKALEDARTAMKPVDERLDAANSPEGRAKETQAATALDEATKRRDAANEKSQKAAADLAKQEAELAAAREQQAKLIPIITETARIKTEQDAAAARKRDIAAGRTSDAPPVASAAPAAPVVPIVSNAATPGRQVGPEGEARNRAAALGAVAAGAAPADTRASPGDQILAGELAKAAEALQKNPTTDNIEKIIELLTALGKGQSDLANRLRDAESQIKTARTR